MADKAKADEGKGGFNPAMAAAIVGGAAAATAGAFWSARALKRRNAGEDGELNAVMETAVTATELAHGDGADRA